MRFVKYKLLERLFQVISIFIVGHHTVKYADIAMDETKHFAIPYPLGRDVTKNLRVLFPRVLHLRP